MMKKLLDDGDSPSIDDAYLANELVNSHYTKTKQKVAKIQEHESEIINHIILGYFQTRTNKLCPDSLEASRRYSQFLIWFKRKCPHLSWAEDMDMDNTNRIIESEIFRLVYHRDDWKDFWKFILRWAVG